MPKFEGAPNMNNAELNPNEIGADANGGKKPEGELKSEELKKSETEVGQGEEAKDSLKEGNAEQVTEEQVVGTISRVEDVDKKILETRRRTAEDEAKINSLRESLGVTSDSEISQSANFNNHRVAGLEAERNELTKERDGLIEEFGRDNLPEGLALEDGEDGREAKGVQFSPEKQPELTNKEKREQAKERRDWLEAWKKDAVTNFEKGMKNDWRTKDAINLETTIKVMKLRVPDAMEKEMKDFVDGKTEDLPSVVWIHWNCNSLFDQTLGKPNMIKNLDITFDNEVVKLADKKDLEKKDEKIEESKSEQEPKENTSPNESTLEVNSAEGKTTKSPKA